MRNKKIFSLTCRGGVQEVYHVEQQNAVHSETAIRFKGNGETFCILSTYLTFTKSDKSHLKRKEIDYNDYFIAR
jgi:hypothetical protein